MTKLKEPIYEKMNTKILKEAIKQTEAQLMQEVPTPIEEIEVITEPMENKKTRKASTTYTIKSFQNNIKKLSELKMITQEEETELKTIHTKMLHRWISLEMEI